MRRLIPTQRRLYAAYLYRYRMTCAVSDYETLRAWALEKSFRLDWLRWLSWAIQDPVTAFHVVCIRLGFSPRG